MSKSLPILYATCALLLLPGLIGAAERPNIIVLLATTAGDTQPCE